MWRVTTPLATNLAPQYTGVVSCRRSGRRGSHPRPRPHPSPRGAPERNVVSPLVSRIIVPPSSWRSSAVGVQRTGTRYSSSADFRGGPRAMETGDRRTWADCRAPANRFATSPASRSFRRIERSGRRPPRDFPAASRTGCSAAVLEASRADTSKARVAAVESRSGTATGAAARAAGPPRRTVPPAGSRGFTPRLGARTMASNADACVGALETATDGASPDGGSGTRLPRDRFVRRARLNNPPERVRQ